MLTTEKEIDEYFRNEYNVDSISSEVKATTKLIQYFLIEYLHKNNIKENYKSDWLLPFLKSNEAFWIMTAGKYLMAKYTDGCHYLKFKDKRKTLKYNSVSDSVIIDLKWLSKNIISLAIEKKEQQKEEQVGLFQNKLIVPYMIQKIIDESNVLSENVVADNNYITIKNFCRINSYSRILIWPASILPTNDFEDKLWNVRIRSEVIPKMTEESVLLLLKSFSLSGIFKN